MTFKFVLDFPSGLRRRHDGQLPSSGCLGSREVGRPRPGLADVAVLRRQRRRMPKVLQHARRRKNCGKRSSHLFHRVLKGDFMSYLFLSNKKYISSMLI